MSELDWNQVREKYSGNPITFTKTGKEFRVSRVTETAIYIDLPSGEEYVSRENLERAVTLVQRGIRLNSPSDYKRQVYDQRPAYAWAILRDLGFVL